jgi:hypothetical protein
LFVYAPMDTMKDGWALPVSRVKAVTEKPIDLGDLTIQPALTVRGRIALADGKPMPPHTRVYLSRQDAWDSTSVETGADGSFSFSRLSPGVVT